MPDPRRPDLFGDDAQAEQAPGGAPTLVYRADPDKVRAQLHRILAQIRAAETLPWNDDDSGYYRTVFPQMTQWLPEEEAALGQIDADDRRLYHGPSFLLVRDRRMGHHESVGRIGKVNPIMLR